MRRTDESESNLIFRKYNFILETGSPGGLWVSTGSSALQKVYTGSLNGNGGTDWHIGEWASFACAYGALALEARRGGSVPTSSCGFNFDVDVSR